MFQYSVLMKLVVCILFLMIEIVTFGESNCIVTSYSAFCNAANLTSIPVNHINVALRIIDLSDNNIMSLIGANEILRTSKSSLEQLTLRNNVIQEIPANTFHGMTNLHELDLSWNQISSSLTSVHFKDVGSLDYLSLAHNKLSCIQEGSFKSLTKLTELDLSYNSLTSQSHCFSRDTICHLSNLIVLRISSNKLPDVFFDLPLNSSVGFLSCLTRLTNLQASNCGIKYLSPATFVGLNHMTSLDLSRNSIVTWPLGVLRNTASLVYLDLGFNNLKNLPTNFISGCPNLSHLSLRNNELRSLNAGWLQIFNENSTLPEKSLFDIVNTIKQYLSTYLDDAVAEITNNKQNSLWMDWSGNPWLCNCDMLPFVYWIITQGAWLSEANGYRDVTCYDPAYQRGERLFDVYVTGMIDRRTVSNLIDKCVSEVSTRMTLTTRMFVMDLSTMGENTVSDHNTAEPVHFHTGTTGTNYTTETHTKQAAVSGPQHSSNVNETSNRSYVTIIILSVIADLVISLVIVFAVKRWCCRSKQRRWATVAPASSQDTSAILSSLRRQDVKLTPISM
ncbi:uncharacterized protein LOC100187176 [Ciona intestinalis]